MRKRKRVVFILLVCIILSVTGCQIKQVQADQSQAGQEETGQTQTDQAQADPIQTNEIKTVMYENTEAGFRVFESSRWKIGMESKSKPINVIFENNNIKAIVTTLENEKSNAEIKKELVNGVAGNVSIIEENEDYLAFRTEQKESIRTDIFIIKKGVRKGIIIFMVPLKEFEKNREAIEEFRKNFELL